MTKSEKISLTKKKSRDIKNIKNIRKNLPINNFKPLLKNKSTKNIIYIMLATVIIHILYLGGVLYYLVKLRDCECYQIRNKINYSNLTYLIIIESILMIFSIITLIGLLTTISTINNLKSGGGNKTLHPSLYIGFTIYILINGLFVYYVYKLYQNVDFNDKDGHEYCKCSHSWLRYLLYIQSLIILIGIITNSYNMISHHF